MNIEQNLLDAIRERRALLFVGAGVSKCLGLPTFSELINQIADELGFDAELFATHGDYLSLAEYYFLEKGTLGPLRSWMDRTWHAGIDINGSDIHKAIVELDFPIIYTTNYDSWLERAYAAFGRKYLKIANVGDLSKAREGVPQIVKFHGDFDADESIVLTESSYFARMDFESPLDIKLRSDLLGRAVLFIGYSLTDMNMRYMLYRLNRQWEQSLVHSTARPKSYIFLARPNPVQQRILESREVTPIVSEADDPKDGLLDFLQSLSSDAGIAIP